MVGYFQQDSLGFLMPMEQSQCVTQALKWKSDVMRDCVGGVISQSLLFGQEWTLGS